MLTLLTPLFDFPLVRDFVGYMRATYPPMRVFLATVVWFIVACVLVQRRHKWLLVPSWIITALLLLVSELPPAIPAWRGPVGVAAVAAAMATFLPAARRRRKRKAKADD